MRNKFIEKYFIKGKQLAKNLDWILKLIIK